jgi:hypothetical protein
MSRNEVDLIFSVEFRRAIFDLIRYQFTTKNLADSQQ